MRNDLNRTKLILSKCSLGKLSCPCSLSFKTFLVIAERMNNKCYLRGFTSQMSHISFKDDTKQKRFVHLKPLRDYADLIYCGIKFILLHLDEHEIRCLRAVR